MKRIRIALVALILCFSLVYMGGEEVWAAAQKNYGRRCVDNSCAAGYDLSDVTGMSDGDAGYIPGDPTYGGPLSYLWDEDSGLSESLPDVKDSDIAGDGRWILQVKPIQGGGTGAATASAARTNLGVPETLNDLDNPSASKIFTMGAYKITLTTASDGADTLEIESTVDNNTSEAVSFKVNLDCSNTDTECVALWLRGDDDGDGTGAEDILKIVGSASGWVATGALILNISSTNFASIDNYKVNTVSLNDLDFGFTVGQTFTTINASGAITGISSLIPQSGASYDIGANYTTCGGRWFQNGDADAIEFTLPAATVGDVCCFADDFGGVISVDPDDGTDYIVVDGTSYGAGDELDTEGNDGDFVCVQATSTDEWVARGRSGALADGGAS